MRVGASTCTRALGMVRQTHEAPPNGMHIEPCMCLYFSALLHYTSQCIRLAAHQVRGPNDACWGFHMHSNSRHGEADLRLGNHGLEVEKGRLRGMEFDRRTCKRCQSGEVDDVYHLLFHCLSTGHLRMDPRHAQMLQEWHGDVCKLM